MRLCVTLSPQASQVIDELLEHGLYGVSRAEIAQRFIYAGLREAVPPKPLRPRGRR